MIVSSTINRTLFCVTPDVINLNTYYHTPKRLRLIQRYVHELELSELTNVCAIAIIYTIIKRTKDWNAPMYNYRMVDYVEYKPF